MLTGIRNTTVAGLAALAGLCAPALADTRLAVLPGNISASSYAGHVPADSSDGRIDTYWAADASAGPQWIQYPLGGCYNVTGVDLAWTGAGRYRYAIQTSVDGNAWTTEYEGVSQAAGVTPLAEVAARQVRIVSSGSDAGSSIGLGEAAVLTSGAARCPGSPDTSELRMHASAMPTAAVASPGANFDLGGYTLQLPTGTQGKVDTVSGAALESGYSNPPYFYSGSDGAMVMMDPRTGATTSGSLHPRTELRENATWTTGGTNLLDANLAVTKVPGNTAIAQIFQGTGPSKPLCELQYSSGGNVKLFLENTNQGGSSTTTTITNVPLGQKFTYQLKLSGKTITVKVNGITKTFTMDDSFVGERFYFKAGNYDQTATAGTPQTADGTVVKFYGLKISH